MNVECGVERGGVEVNPDSQQRLWCFWDHLADHKIVEGKVDGLAEVEPLFNSNHDDELILFCLLLLIWEEAVAFPHLFLDRLRDLALSIFEVCLVNFDALFERADFFPLLDLDALPI